MAKVFTITEGLENLGALKSGGQGSVYKARKTGEIITAIKILPTPIYSETEADKHFTSFQNEVQKLKKVNEVPNPNVVSIITSGITSSGNLPYIEMEYIEGADLGELLKPPFDPVFTIKETIKVADQLANALAHCHRANIKHGDIKSNNVKFNQHTGNYILLDFGLSVMSDEQRRTSIRYAGAIEFMAPEQSAGETLFETDIYSFGIILFELLAGTVPFPLTNKGEMARNAVMLAHMEALPPDIISLRRQVLPDSWSVDKSEREIQLPAWLLNMIYKCLEKDPLKRFRNGGELQEFIHFGTVAEEQKKVVVIKPAETTMLHLDESVWRKEVQKLQAQVAQQEELLHQLQYQVVVKDKALYQAKFHKPKGASRFLFLFVMMMATGLAGYTAYVTFYHPVSNVQKVSPALQVENNAKFIADTPVVFANKTDKNPNDKIENKINATAIKETIKPKRKMEFKVDSTGGKKKHAIREYEIVNKAYFHSAPDTSSRTNLYLTAGDTELTTLDEKNNFIYVVFKSGEGETTKGWLSKKDIIPAGKK
jgi:serine/threonine-protein kinase